MPITPQLTARFREVLIDGKWVAFTNYHDQLSQTDWKQATTQVGSLNTLAKLTFHINYYLDGVLNVFRGGALEIRDKYSFDMPPIESAADWEKLRSELFENAEAFAGFLSQIPEEQWDTPFVDEKYGTWLRNMQGTIEHCYYHLGQIVIIRKMIAEG